MEPIPISGLPLSGGVEILSVGLHFLLPRCENSTHGVELSTPSQGSQEDQARCVQKWYTPLFSLHSICCGAVDIHEMAAFVSPPLDKPFDLGY